MEPSKISTNKRAILQLQLQKERIKLNHFRIERIRKRPRYTSSLGRISNGIEIPNYAPIAPTKTSPRHQELFPQFPLSKDVTLCININNTTPSLFNKKIQTHSNKAFAGELENT
jgi:hypothetical protein